MSLPLPTAAGQLETINGKTYETILEPGGRLVWRGVTTGTQGPRLDKIEKKTDKSNFLDFDVKADGSDDLPGLLAYWQHCLDNNLPFDLSGGFEFTISSAASDDGTVKSYFNSGENDNVTVVFGMSKIKVVPPAGQGQANLFDVQQTKGFYFDIINFEVDLTRASAGDNVRAMVVRHGTANGSQDVKGYYVRGVNAEGVLVTTDLADYVTNGFDSVYRSKDIHIMDINIDNSDMPFSYVTEYTGYGITCQLSGDDCVVDKLTVDNIHRAVFVYGVKGFKVKGGKVVESNATTVNIGAYGSVEDCEVKLNIVQNNALATELVRVKGNEVGTSNGQSLDIQGGRTHVFKDIKLDILAEGTTGTLDRVLDVNKTYGDGLTDSAFHFIDIDIKLVSKHVGISRSLVLFGDVATQPSLNMYCENVVVRDSNCVANARIGLLPNMRGNIKVKDSNFKSSLICQYGSFTDQTVNSDNMIVFENTKVGLAVSQNTMRDVPVKLIDSHVGIAVLSVDNILPAQNKIVQNSILGNKLIEDSVRYGVYTNINDSSSMYSPDYPVSRIVGGASSIGSAASPKSVDLVAASDLKTDVSAEIYHEYFFAISTFGRTKSNAVEIYVRAAGSSNWAHARGYLVSEGLSTKDFTSKDFRLVIQEVVNVGLGGYTPSDFSLTVVDANTLRFSCSVNSQDLVVSILD